ncbi:UNVERIFIED_CONTAM: Retrovirus-related Pol polyprotein from transposon TNT 1-94 [Sesamum calycinum]|uniref:Retrovirus-related Pol polyprotein from transposon TNT 1-94 n=1 Tax=Sesamum calycinum TaxID=2727403 RepID=A0AAW2MCN7_9LAMI
MRNGLHELELIADGEVTTLVDRPKGVKPGGSMAKSIWIMLPIAACLKQASRSWNIRFDEVIRGYDFVKNDFDPCVYKKDLGEASDILGIKIFRDRSKRILGMTQNSYVEKVLKSIQYVAQCTRPDIAYALSVISRYQVCAGEAHWTAVKTILKYLRMTKDVFLSGFVFKLNGGVLAWKSSKKDTTTNSTTEAEYIATSEAAEETKRTSPRGWAAHWMAAIKPTSEDWSGTFQVEDLEIGHRDLQVLQPYFVGRRRRSFMQF